MPPLPSAVPLRALRTAAFTLLTAPFAVHAAEEAPIKWLVEYGGATPPTEATRWKQHGSGLIESKDGVLRTVDDSPDTINYLEATWTPDPDKEIIVEARLKLVSMTGSIRNKPGTSLWPWRDGAPVGVQVSDGRHEDGLVLFPAQAASFTDRFIPMDTTNRFHTYRLIIRGNDMRMEVDGEAKVEGQNAFWHAAKDGKPYIRFGSTAKNARGEALWEYVKLGQRDASGKPGTPPVAIAVTPPWEIKRDKVRQTRPYLYDMGRGLLLVSIAQGPDAFYEPYGVLKSTDEGQTWTPIEGLDLVDYAPLPLVRRPNGKILGASRWTWQQPDGSLTGVTVHLNEDASSFTKHESRIILPKEYTPAVKSDVVIFERHIWNDPDGGLTTVLWSRIGVTRPDGRRETVRYSHLVRSMDEGKTWTHLSVIGPGGEPAVARITEKELTAVIRGARGSRMTQVFSHDGGKTWDEPITLEVGKVAPDLVLMSNGVLACSYGRPSSCLMFSKDGGRTWPAHYVISDRVGFNYSSIREISPGRLLYLHDAPSLRGVYVDVSLEK